MTTFGTLYSGIGGADLGLARCGWQCLWQCENDPYRMAILARHWGQIPMYADVFDAPKSPRNLYADVVYAEIPGPVPSYIDPLLRVAQESQPPVMLLETSISKQENMHVRIAEGLTDAGYQVAARTISYGTSAIVDDEWRMVVSEPRTRAMFFALRRGAFLGTAAPTWASVFGPALLDDVMRADEDTMPIADLEIARGFPAGWTCTCGEESWKCRCDTERRRVALREATSPMLMQWLRQVIEVP